MSKKSNKGKNNDYIFKIDQVRVDAACDAFFKWKDLNTYIKIQKKLLTIL